MPTAYTSRLMLIAACPAPMPKRAGRAAERAARKAAKIRSKTQEVYAADSGPPSCASAPGDTAPSRGALWVCVAVIMTWSAGMPSSASIRARRARMSPH